MLGIHLEDYLARSGDGGLYAGGTLHEVPGVGWAVMELTGNVLYIHQMYGDGRAWDAYCQEYAQTYGAEKIMFVTRRNPKPIVRRYGFQIVGHLMSRRIRWEQQSLSSRLQ